jgi:hypothetical protein
VRFVLAIVCFVASAFLIGLGIAQKTVLAEPDELTASVEVTSDAPVTVISGETLNALPRSQFVEIGGADTRFAAYGRTADVDAWVGDASHNVIGYDAQERNLTSTLVEGEEAEVPNPAGSDLWLDSYDNVESLNLNVPENVSLLIVSDGIAPAPSELSITWPLDNSTPWANTFVFIGGVVLFIGLLFLFWAIAHVRRGRGPRRKSPKMPKLPRQPRLKAIKASPKSIESTAKGRRAVNNRIAVVPLVLVGALALGGCSSDFWAGRAPAPEPSATSEPAADAQAAAQIVEPVVTVKQAERIISEVRDVATTADASNDGEALATRFAGPALDLRSATYNARKVDPAIAQEDAIPTGEIILTLPEQSDTWPRTIFATIDDPRVADDGKTFAPVALVLVQDDPRAQYKANFVMRLAPGVVVPEVAPANVGAVRVPPESKFLSVAPEVLSAGYGDILLTDTASASYELFEPAGDQLRADFGLAYKNSVLATFPATSSLTYEAAASEAPAIPLATNDSGAIVAVDINELQTAKPVVAGATANAVGKIAALAGKTTSGKGFAATRSFQVLFFVPSVQTGGKTTVLGYSQGIIAASELP